MTVASMLNQPALWLQKSASIGLLAATFVAVPTIAVSQPADFAPFEVEYDVGNNMISAGSATLQLAKEGNEWVYSLKTKPSGVFKLTGKGRIQEVSVFNVSDATDALELKPQRYTYRQDKETRRSVDAWFDWKEKQLTYKRRGEEMTETFSDPVLDRLSVTLTVMDALKHDDFDQVQLNVFDSGGVKSMSFSNEGNETVKTRMGALDTIRVRSNNVGGGTRHTTTWFAPELGFVPVKIEQYKRNKLVARLTLTKLRNQVTESGGAKAYSGK